MAAYRIALTKRAQKDAVKIDSTGLRDKAWKLISIIASNPFQTPPSCEKLLGDLAGLYSRRINIQHRIVYEVKEEEKVIVIRAMWTHYE